MSTLHYQNGTPGMPSALRAPLTRWLLRFASPFAWGFAALILIGIFAGLGGLIGSVAGFSMGLAITLFIAISLRQAMRSSRRARGIMVLGYLENAVRLNFPLPQFLRAAAHGERYITRRRLMHLAQAVDRGENIGIALADMVPEVPQRSAAVLASAERVGQLQPSLTRLLKQTRNDAPITPPGQAAAAIYPLLVSFFSIAIIGFTMWFVMPKFREIFRDFNTKLPWLTQQMLGVAEFVSDTVPLVPIIFVFLALFFFIYVARTLRYTFTPWWPSLMIGPSAGWIIKYTPFVRKLQLHASMADLCQFLADSTRAGIPLPTALGEAYSLQMTSGLRNKVLDWKDFIIHGLSPELAAKKAGMPSLLVGFLTVSVIPGKADATSLPELYDFLASYYRAKYSRLIVTLTAIAEPLVTVTLAIVVGTIIVALFLPLAKLIASVAGGSDTGAL